MLRQRNMEKGYLWNLVLAQEKAALKLDFDFIKELTIFDENNNEYNLLGPKREEDKKNGILTELYWEELDVENYDLRKAVHFGTKAFNPAKKGRCHIIKHEAGWATGRYDDGIRFRDASAEDCGSAYLADVPSFEEQYNEFCRKHRDEGECFCDKSGGEFGGFYCVKNMLLCTLLI